MCVVWCVCVCLCVFVILIPVPCVTVRLIYRLWDFDRDENYLLELSSVGQVPHTAHATFIDYNKIKGKR